MNSTKLSLNNRILNYLEDKIVPWQSKWVGWGDNVGFPKNITGKKYFGVNAIVLQMSARENRFVSNLWGTAEQFDVNNLNGTEILLYNTDILSNKPVVYNLDQIRKQPPESTLRPNYSLVDHALSTTNAKIKFNDSGKAFYYYPPYDYITLPKKEYFEYGCGGLPGYYETLAHELMHWTEPKLNFEDNKAICELRAEIGSNFLVEELCCPHSIAFSNFEQWRLEWIRLMKEDTNLIFRVAEAACNAVDYILNFSR